MADPKEQPQDTPATDNKPELDAAAAAKKAAKEAKQKEKQAAKLAKFQAKQAKVNNNNGIGYQIFWTIVSSQ